MAHIKRQDGVLRTILQKPVTNRQDGRLRILLNKEPIIFLLKSQTFFLEY